MAYFSSLADFQTAQKQIAQHANDLEQESKDRKAGDIQEKFEYLDKMMNESGGAIGGFGGAFHLGRKVYKKVQGARDKAKELQSKADDLKQKLGKETKPEENPIDNLKANGTEDSNVNIGEQENVPEYNASRIKSDDAPSADADTGEVGENINQAFDRLSGADDRPPPAQADPQANTASRAPAEGDVELEGRSTSALEEGGTKVMESQGEGGARIGAVSDDIAEGAGRAGSRAATDAGNLLKNGVDSDEIIGQGTKVVAKAVAKVGGDAIGGAMETAGAVLDFLGPVGEVVGAGLALGSFFHDLFGHKKEQAQEIASKGGPQQTTASVGLDTSSIATQAQKTNVVGTLV